MYIGIDLGTTAVKTVAYDGTGKVLSRFEIEYELLPLNGDVYQNANDWWDCVSLGIRTVVAKSPIDSVAVGIERVIESGNDMSGILNYRTK